MSKVERFEDLQVWQMAHDLSVAIYGLTRDGEFSKDWGLRDQIQRAAVSVMSNIAEGFERYSRQEFKQFLPVFFHCANANFIHLQHGHGANLL